LATASAISRLSNQPGRAIVTARGNHFVVDSVPPLGGPNEELNPLDLMLGALATCGTFVYETAAEEMGIPLTAITATVEGDFDPTGVKDGSVNPRIQALRVHMDLTGPSEAQAEALAAEFQTRCPIYTTLSRSAPIDISTGAKVEAEVMEGLATAMVVSRLSNQPGRAIVSARGNHFVVDSVPPLGGPNEERNPLDLALGALATCGTFIYETAAEEMGIPLTAIAATVEGDFDPAGVKDGSVNPRIQALRVKMELTGANMGQAKRLAKEFQARCPIYTTLSRSAPIEIENEIE
ncbi:MAG: OsmC family protein, partial [Anaerolineae bacterium]